MFFNNFSFSIYGITLLFTNFLLTKENLVKQKNQPCTMPSSQGKSLMAQLLKEYDKATKPSGGILDVQAEVFCWIFY